MLRKRIQRITTRNLSEKKPNRPILFKSCRVNFFLTATIWNKYLSCHTLSLSSRIVKAFQYKAIDSILYTNTEFYKIGFRTNDLCTFWDNQPESLTHLFYHCSRSKPVLDWIWTILVPYFESTNSSLLGKCALWNFDGKCLPFTSIAEPFYNYWKTLLVGLQEQTNPSKHLRI